MTTYRTLEELENLTLTELIPGLINEITPLSDFASVIFPRTKVLTRPSITLNRTTSHGSAAWLDGSCLVSTSSPSAAQAVYSLKDVATAFDVCMPLADKMSTESDVIQGDLLAGILRMAETLENAFVSGTGDDGQPYGLQTEVTTTVDVSGDAGNDLLVAMDMAFQRARPKRDMIWLAHPDAEIAFIKEVREQSSGETIIGLLNTDRSVAGYKNVPMVISEYAAENTITLASVAEEGYNAYLGYNSASAISGLFGLRGPISKQGSLIDQWQLTASTLGFIRNRQTAITITGVV